MRRYLNLHCALSFAAACVAGYALYAAWSWPFRTALFPRLIAVPMLVLALLELGLSASGNENASAGHAVDFQLTDTVEPSMARKRTIAIVIWILGFMGLILVAGFPLAVPIFVGVYLKIVGGESWKLTVALTALSWLLMDGLFGRLLHIPFPDGWVLALWR